jgi:CheY-like chemotaxis protein
MISVLVTDDSHTIRLLLREWLTSAGFAVEEAADGQQALDKLMTSDGRMIVLLDYQMPIMDGYEVLRRAAAASLLPPRYSYVMISAAIDQFPPQFSTLLRQLGIQILPKPFDRDTILGVTRFLAARMEQSAGNTTEAAR